MLITLSPIAKLTKDLFHTSFASWKDTWLLDIGATCHMTFWKDFFEDLSNNVDGVIYFGNTSSLKPSRLGTTKLKLSGLLDFLLHCNIPN